jgi:hypothetical protein
MAAAPRLDCYFYRIGYHCNPRHFRRVSLGKMMKKTNFAIFAMTGLALVGCNRGAANNSAAAGNNSSTANASTPAAPAATGAGAPVDQAFLVGHWSPAPDCSQTMSFNADGTAEATGEREEARWTLEGGAVLAGPVGKPPVRTPVSRSGDKLILAGPQGQSLTLSRCQSAAADAPATGADATNEAAEAEETAE